MLESQDESEMNHCADVAAIWGQSSIVAFFFLKKRRRKHILLVLRMESQWWMRLD